jgi:Tol biopolymer transport system component
MCRHVYLKPSTNSPELIAHELEHILEQLDGVNLEAQAGNGAVWKGDRTFFETRRAIETGRRVVREMPGGDRIGDARETQAVAAVDKFLTVKLRDRDATPTSPRTAHVSADGRYVVFISPARLVDDDRNLFRDEYVTDLATGRTTLESVGPDGGAGNGESYSAEISGNGRYVVFESHAGNLTAPSFPTGSAQIFLRDRAAGMTRLLTTNAAGAPANGPSGQPVISVDGSAVAFESTATDLAGVPDGGRPQTVGIYLMSLVTGVRLRLDTVAGKRSAGSSMSPAIAADGRHVVFASKADLTCPDAGRCSMETPDGNGVTDVYIYDTESRTTRRVSRNQSGGDANGASYDPAISGDGRFVAFVSDASNLTSASPGRASQIYLHDLTSGATTLVTRTLSGHPVNGSSLRPALSFDGSTIVFQSLATNLLCEKVKKCPPQLEDFNLLWDVFVFDVRTNRMARMSADGVDEWMENSRGPSIDSAGRVVAFGSRHPIGASDAAHDEDLYVVRVEPARLVSTR